LRPIGRNSATADRNQRPPPIAAFDDATVQLIRWRMPIPDYQALMLPVLRILGDGTDHTAPAVIDAVATEFKLTPEEREQLAGNQRIKLIASRAHWAMTYLAQAGLTDRPSRGVWRVTDVACRHGRHFRYRLSQRGNRRLNHAIHMAAVTQIRHAHSDGRAYYDKKIAEGKTPKEALRCLKRRISNAIWARLRADARPAAPAGAEGPGGQPGNDTASSAAGSHPARQLFGPATPEPGPEPTTPNRQPPAQTKKTQSPLDNQH
jgi:hypothetical protein